MQRTEAPDGDHIARAHAIYTPLMLSTYDVLVHGLSNRFAWLCPTQQLIELYRTNLPANHLEAGVGTGFFIDRAGARISIGSPCSTSIAIVSTVPRIGSRISSRRSTKSTFSPRVGLDLAPFSSVGLTDVLHCLPGSMSQKLVAVDHLRALMRDGGVAFGATILGSGVAPISDQGAARSV
jgi:hypothetical protein